MSDEGFSRSQNLASFCTPRRIEETLRASEQSSPSDLDLKVSMFQFFAPDDTKPETIGRHAAAAAEDMVYCIFQSFFLKKNLSLIGAVRPKCQPSGPLSPSLNE